MGHALGLDRRNVSCSLRQAFMLMELRMGEGQKPAVAAEMLVDAREAWVQQTREGRVSAVHRDVERVFRLIGEEPSVEYVTDDGFFAIDLAFPGTASCCGSL